MIPIASYTQNKKLDPRYLIPVRAPLRVPITNPKSKVFIIIPVISRIRSILYYTNFY